MDTYELTNGSQCRPTRDQRKIDACPSHICTCHSQYLREVNDAKEAHTRLIARAPELEAENRALKELLQEVVDLEPEEGDVHYQMWCAFCKDDPHLDDCLIKRAQAVLNKAKGGE